MRVGLRTRIDVPGPVDPGDLDAVTVLPVRRTVLLALDGLGFALRGADVEKGHVRNRRGGLLPSPARRPACSWRSATPAGSR
jgi:sporulation-control protein spo0M